MKAIVAAFNQEKALVGAFSVIMNLRMEFFQALVQENCDLLGSVLWQGEDVTAHNCQEILQLLGPVYGGEVFSYSSLDHTCSILDTGARRCSAVSGPRQPSVEECEAATSTPAPVTTTPAPTSGDGRC